MSLCPAPKNWCTVCRTIFQLLIQFVWAWRWAVLFSAPSLVLWVLPVPEVLSSAGAQDNTRWLWDAVLTYSTHVYHVSFKAKDYSTCFVPCMFKKCTKSFFSYRTSWAHKVVGGKHLGPAQVMRSCIWRRRPATLPARPLMMASKSLLLGHRSGTNIYCHIMLVHRCFINLPHGHRDTHLDIEEICE